MPDLVPFPFGRLLSRVFRELETQDSIFDLPRGKFFLGDAERDLSVRFHGMPASTALGPSAGPHSQLAQNIVLAWLGGSRIMELKTVQILDELEIGRPCIDAQTVCYNIEWSQELKLEQSLDEYVKASMLLDILVASGRIELTPGFESVIFDMSVGYDLAGIRSERVRAFMDGMMDATPIVDRLRREIPDEFAAYRDLDFRTKLSNSLTLSTFHGCPPDEIERIIDFLLREFGLNCIIKLNPTLLGPERVRSLMRETMGYDAALTPDDAFEKDTKWDQMLGFVERLGDTADGLGLGLGVKFSNTLIVENHRDFFPEAEQQMYLSGQPLYVLAMNLVRDFRRAFGDRYPISFSAGVDRWNFTDAVALGLTPVTVCTDLLRPGGYARQGGYFETLAKRMDEVGASNVPEFILRAYSGVAREALNQAGGAWGNEFDQASESGPSFASLVDPAMYDRWVSAAKLLNTELHVDHATNADRYTYRENTKVPKKIGSMLELFNCVTCDKCIPVCPNDANFRLMMPRMEVPIVKLLQSDTGWESSEAGVFVLDKKHQIGNFNDFCNDCGNCDVFCPEDGGPYILKPRFFGSLDEWRSSTHLEGFFLEQRDASDVVYGRFGSAEFHVEVGSENVAYSGEGFDIRFDAADPAGTVEGTAAVAVDLTFYHIMDELRRAIFASDAPVNFVNA